MSATIGTTLRAAEGAIVEHAQVFRLAVPVVAGAAFLGAHGQSFGDFGRRLVKGFHMGNMRHVAGEVKG